MQRSQGEQRNISCVYEEMRWRGTLDSTYEISPHPCPKGIRKTAQGCRVRTATLGREAAARWSPEGRRESIPHISFIELHFIFMQPTTKLILVPREVGLSQDRRCMTICSRRPSGDQLVWRYLTQGSREYTATLGCYPYALRVR